MAPPAATPPAEAPSAAESLRRFLRLGAIVLGIAVLGFILYMMFIGSDPRRSLKTPEEALNDYTNFVRGFVGPSAPSPDSTWVGRWLDYFDPATRDWFRSNKDHIARLQMQFDVEQYNRMTDAERGNQAMRYLVNVPPLNGIVSVQQRRNEGDDKAVVTVRTRTGQPADVTMVRRSGIWYITDLGGARARVESDIARFKPKTE